MVPLVSVCVISYNHAAFIEKCLESIFFQDYPRIQLVISDDCSLDATSELALKVIERLSGENVTVKFLRNTVNIGATDNFLQALSACDGEYIAFCEGDDYWLDSAKLSHQVKVLGSSPEISAVSGLSLIKKLDGFHPPTSNKSRDVTLLKYIMGFKSEMRLCSLMVRRTVINEEFIRLANSVNAQDNLIRVIALKQGDIKVLGRVVSVYRNEGQGVWNSQLIIRARKKSNNDLFKLCKCLPMHLKFILLLRILFKKVLGRS